MRVIGSSGPAPPPPLPRRLVLARRLQRSRRFAVALLLALASGSAVHAVAAARSSPRSVGVVIAARDLPSGTSLSTPDTAVAALPAALVPVGAFRTRSQAAGRVLTGAVRRGEVLTDARVSGRGLLAGSRHGELALPLRVDAPLPAGLLQTGDTVAVLAGSDGSSERDGDVAAADDGEEPVTGAAGGEVLVRRARVLALPGGLTGTGGSGTTGLLGSGGSAASGSGSVVVLALDAAQAADVTGVAGQRPLTLALVGS